jgi:hypothetical protein
MKIWIAVFLFACTIAPRGFAQSGGEADMASEILELERVWNRAAEAKDLNHRRAHSQKIQ